MRSAGAFHFRFLADTLHLDERPPLVATKSRRVPVRYAQARNYIQPDALRRCRQGPACKGIVAGHLSGCINCNCEVILADITRMQGNQFKRDVYGLVWCEAGVQRILYYLSGEAC